MYIHIFLWTIHLHVSFFELATHVYGIDSSSDVVIYKKIFSVILYLTIKMS